MNDPTLGSTEGLKQLWKDRIAVILSNIEHHEEQHREIANAASHIGTDYHGRFLVELIQNASDQVAKAAGTVSTVVIIRTKACIAVLNEGIPFDEEGVKSITSLALSGKNAEENLGNKGIGFKSVFQVSDGPEIYSASAAGCGLKDQLRYAFKLDRNPLQRAELRSEIQSIVGKQIVERPALRAALLAKNNAAGPVDVALQEIGAAPPWKFPVPRSHSDLEAHARMLGLRDEWLESMQTLVVLPLSYRALTHKDLADAMEEIRSPTALLFLPRIRELIVIDRVLGRSDRIQKKTIGTPRTLAGGAEMVVFELSSGPLDRKPVFQRWWIASRTIGKALQASDENADKEQQALKRAAGELPGEGWSDVEHATVSVGLPQSKPESCLMEPKRGLFCIGLPTRLETGTPFWVDAHFHGNVARTSMEFSLAYNAILLTEAGHLAAKLIDDLKSAADLDARRSVTLAMDWTEGALASCLKTSRLRESAVVLAADGISYIRGRDVAMPLDEDARMLDLLTSGDMLAARAAGFVLPERELFVQKRTLLDSLVPRQVFPSPKGDTRFLARSHEQQSLIELAARRFRGDGVAFWEKFLDWATTRFSTEMLEDQVILPVGTDALAAATERVFIAPMPRAMQGSDDDDDIDLSAMPADVRHLLRFLDETAVRVRVPGKKDLTPIASRLSPARGSALVAHPRIEQVVEHAIAPRLAEATVDPAQRRLALGLLQFAISLTSRLSSKRQSTAKFDQLMVPAGGRGQPWKWVSPRIVYFGGGWTEDSTRADAIEAAFGHRSYGLLVPWEEFATEAGSKDEDRGWWYTGLHAFGVGARPRILFEDNVKAFKALSYDELSLQEIPCPIPAAADFWDDYQRAVAQRKVGRKSGQTYEIARVSWIDGLEREESRAAVFELVLACAEDYVRDATTRVQRADSWDPTDVRSFWAYTIVSQEWPVIPVEGAGGATTAPVLSTWWLAPDDRRKDSSRLLYAPPASMGGAEALFKKLGVVTLAEASPWRLICALHDFSALSPEILQERQTAARALVGELWDRLRAHCARSRSGIPVDLSELTEAPVPLFRGREIEITDLRKVDKIFVNDEPTRSAFVDGFDDSLQLPLMRDVQALAAALSTSVGAQRILKTSETPVVTNFTPWPGEPQIPFLDLLLAMFPDVDVAIDLALLRAYVGRTEIDLEKGEFTEFWSSMERLLVQRGSFEARNGQPEAKSFCDMSSRLLQVAHDMAPSEVVAASWPLATLSHREVWISYAKALSEGRVGQFFAERQIGEAERERVESITRHGGPSKLSAIRTAVFAVALARGLSESLTFESAWEEHARSVPALSQWLGGGLEKVITEALSATNEGDAAIVILRAAGLEIPAWQEGRVALGLPRWSFMTTRENFIASREALVCALKSESVRLVSVDLVAAREAIEAVGKLAPDGETLASLLGPDEALELVVQRADDVFTAVENPAAVAILADRVSAIALGTDASERRAKLDALGTLRERELYRREPDAIRSNDAKQQRDSLLRVAVPLAQIHGETLDPDAIAADDRVSVFCEGWWANRWAVLVSLQKALDAATPVTAKALSEQRAFRDHMDWRLLWTKFPELGSIPEANGVPRPAARTVILFGNDKPADKLEAELQAGSAGAIGKRILDLVDPELDLAAIGAGLRSRAAEVTGSHGGHGGGGAGGGADARADRELNGYLGEAFVYEQLRVLLEDFDEYAWKSESRSKYGFSSGDDGLGYDFFYVDLTGKLAGAPNIECKIEVKATSGDGTSPFPMTIGEWECARACHDSDGRSLYLIVRVANVRTAPRIVDVIRDPFELWKDHKLTISARDLMIRVGALNTKTLVITSDTLPTVPEGRENQIDALAN